ncbi:MAG: alanine--tRNA ligase [Thermoprotei archaeon]|nr:MAG: alanine--tRNA ligase [Thermoprotei archaeon]
MGFQVDPSIYRVRMFKERGYVRQKCKYCGVYFWALRPRNDCNDAPCTDYTFFDIKLRVGPLSVKETKDRFIEFFRRRGHEVIEPHPVVARWREDLYLTIASIVVFQPHVTSGIVQPPANPLVIAQPCIRLEDIDSVGYTFGRHLTNFIMGGHHAFNYPDKFVYFTHETVELAREFFVDDLGVPEAEITFKESWWEGGGNAGPCFEVAVGGLEVATLVFMMYDVKDGRYVEMPIKIVDTGYGIERISWLTQKSPTAFHAIYGDLVDRYFKMLDLRVPPKEFFEVAVKYIGRLNPKNRDDLIKLLDHIVSASDYSEEEVARYLNDTINVFTLLDHVKTASLMLADGVVPSNAGEGYLARLVLRRIFRILVLLKSEDVLDELFLQQVDYWKALYPQLAKRKDYIVDVISHEARKYREVISRAPSLVRKYIKRGGEGLSLDELIELYDSHGIPPEIASEVASKYGVKVDVPSDFYSRIARRHSSAPIKRTVKEKVPSNVSELVRKLRPTKLLFHEDPYIREFSATIVMIHGPYVVLDQTAFYPEGGGQAADTGYLILPSGEAIRVLDTQKVGSVVIHKLAKELPQNLIGRAVTGRIDWERRYKLMRHHTATHIILGSARQILGDHVWQAGAEKTEERARLDITHYKPLSKEEIRKIEELANKVIVEGRKVKSMYLPKYVAEHKYGFRLYQGGVPLEPVIRVVEIEGLDAEACFGTHVSNTMEVGAIKIVGVDRIADGVVRLEYVAGTQVFEYARSLESKLAEASSILGGDVVQRAKAIVGELKSMTSLLTNYRKLILSSLTKQALAEAEYVAEGIKAGVICLSISDKNIVRELLIKLSSLASELVALAVMPASSGSLVELSLGSKAAGILDAREVLNNLLSKYGGKGGGKKDHASGFVRKDASKFCSEVRNDLLVILRNKLCKL